MAGFYTNNNYIPSMHLVPSSSTVQQQQVHRQHYADISSPTNAVTGHRYDHPHTGMNYNHLPYSSGIPSSIITTLSSVGSASGGLCVTAPGSFTFTSPTRMSYMASSMSQTQPYGQFSSSSGWSHTFAPGLGVPWQHTVPSLMPWTDSGSTATPPTFTGSVAQNYSDTSWSLPCQLDTELPSCSTSSRRPKRHAAQNSCDVPSKQHITEEKMMVSMQGLSLACAGNGGPGLHVGMASGSNINGSSAESSAESSLQRSWKKFRQLEDMLSEDEVTDGSSSTRSGVCIQMPSSVASTLLSSPILPKGVIDTLNKPCMQVVLWKAPAEYLGEVVSEKMRRNRSRKGGVASHSKSRPLTARIASGVTSCSSSLNTPISSTTPPLQSLNDLHIASLDEEEDSAMEL